MEDVSESVVETTLDKNRMPVPENHLHADSGRDAVVETVLDFLIELFAVAVARRIALDTAEVGIVEIGRNRRTYHVADLGAGVEEAAEAVVAEIDMGKQRQLYIGEGASVAERLPFSYFSFQPRCSTLSSAMMPKWFCSIYLATKPAMKPGVHV